MVEHDKLVELVREKTNWLNADSWNQKGRYYFSFSKQGGGVEGIQDVIRESKSD